MTQIADWKKLSSELKRVKAEEATLRRELCALIIAEAEMTKGRVTVRATIDNFECKAVQTLNYTLDLAVLATIWETLSVEEKEAFKLVPKLQEGVYKKLAAGSLVHEAVVTSMAMPTLVAELPGV